MDALIGCGFNEITKMCFNFECTFALRGHPCPTQAYKAQHITTGFQFIYCFRYSIQKAAKVKGCVLRLLQPPPPLPILLSPTSLSPFLPDILFPLKLIDYAAREKSRASVSQGSIVRCSRNFSLLLCRCSRKMTFSRFVVSAQY